MTSFCENDVSNWNFQSCHDQKLIDVLFFMLRKWQFHSKLKFNCISKTVMLTFKLIIWSLTLIFIIVLKHCDLWVKWSNLYLNDVKIKSCVHDHYTLTKFICFKVLKLSFVLLWYVNTLTSLTNLRFDVLSLETLHCFVVCNEKK